MKVKNMVSNKGNAVANQFIIEYDSGITCWEYFQSYDSIIVKRYCGLYNNGSFPKTQLDVNKWDYSITTGRYRNQFLGETKAETQKKIDSGEYELVDLN